MRVKPLYDEEAISTVLRDMKRTQPEVVSSIKSLIDDAEKRHKVLMLELAVELLERNR